MPGGVFPFFPRSDKLGPMGESGQQFAQRLRRVMAEINVSRLTLSRELGVDKSVIGRWLSGINQPTGHNLTRLTNLIRRYRPEVTQEFWQHATREPLSGEAQAEPVGPAPANGLALVGLQAERRKENDANYLGLWAGFYHSTQNRGAVVLAVLHVEDSKSGLRCIFTEGKVSAAGAAIAMGPRLHVILEIEPLHDRLCLFVFNGVGTPDAVAMDGIYMISSGDTSTCVTASPVVMFRLGDDEDYRRVGSLTGVMQALYPLNAQNIQDSIMAGDPAAGLAALVPEIVLRTVCAQVGVSRVDGEIDHVLRMPAHRSLPAANFGVAELPATSPLLATRNSLRRVLGLA